MFEHPANASVTRLVICNGATLLGGDYLVALLQAADNSVDSSHKVLLLNIWFVVTSSDECRLVADIGNICARETGGLLCKEGAVQTGGEFERFEVNIENLLTLQKFGQTNINLTVETTCTHQGLIENIGTVGRCKYYDTRVGTKAIHLGKQLVQSVFALVIARETGVLATRTTDSVNLVNKDNTGSLCLCLLEEVPHSRSTHANKHLHKVRAANREERHICLARYCLCQQGLTRSGRAYQERAFGNLTAKLLVLLGFAEEIDNLHNLHLSLCQTCHILESHLVLTILIEYLSLCLTHIEDTVLAASASCTTRNTTHHKEEETNHQQVGEDSRKEVRPGVAAGLVGEGDNSVVRLLRLVEVFAEGVDRADIELILRTGTGEIFVLLVRAQLLHSLFGEVHLCHILVDNHNLLHTARANHLLHSVPVGGDNLLLGAENRDCENRSQHGNIDPIPTTARLLHRGATLRPLGILLVIVDIFVFVHCFICVKNYSSLS